MFLDKKCPFWLQYIHRTMDRIVWFNT